MRPAGIEYHSVAIRIVSVCMAWMLLAICIRAGAAGTPTVTASTSQSGSAPAGVVDGDRFSSATNHAWKGTAGQSNWWWQIQFAEPRNLGAILQIQGDHSFVFQNSPRKYVWQGSLDGGTWHDLPGTSVEQERRLYRIHRLTGRQKVRFVRIRIATVEGSYPTLREVEFYDNPREHIPFPDWIIAVNTTHDPRLPGHGIEFIPLAKSCPGWESLEAQQVWLGSFDEAFCQVEPRPLCAFLSGNFKDWCQVDREPWRGTQGILKKGRLPIWASCGGAQGLAILATVGVDKPWDCPHCRDPLNPKVPIYTHLGHTDKTPCGDYSACLFERGPHEVRQVTHDPAFRGLPEGFKVMESHCGQIEWPPPGWDFIVTAGPGTQTKSQCLRVKGRPIYAAQFHIEMAGTPEVSRRIAGNFLGIAKDWGGFRPGN